MFLWPSTSANAGAIGIAHGESMLPQPGLRHVGRGIATNKPKWLWRGRAGKLFEHNVLSGKRDMQERMVILLRGEITSNGMP